MSKVLILSECNKGQKVLHSFLLNIGLVIQSSLDIHNIPDMVLMDINYIQMGDKICADLRTISPDVPVLIYSNETDDFHKCPIQINQFEPWNKVYELFIGEYLDPIKLMHLLNIGLK